MDPQDFPYPPPDPCRLCGTAIPGGATRCSECGLHRARELSRADKWQVAAGLLGLYVFVAFVLALSR